APPSPETAWPTDGAVPRLQGAEADGLCRALPGGESPVRRAARGTRETAAERRLVLLRAGDVGGAWLRLPLRFPRPAAHGDRAGAAPARGGDWTGDHRAPRALTRRTR